MIVFTFSILNNKDNKVRYFEKSFLFVNIKLDVVFEIFFIIINKVDINIKTWNLQ